MRAITIRQPWLWAICRGGKDVENRTNRRGQQVAMAQFNRPGPVLLHASSRWEGEDAYRVVRHFSTMDPGMSGLPHSDTAWFGDSGFVAAATIKGVHTADACYDPASGRMCSPWAEENAAHIHLTDVRVLHRLVPHPGALGLWTVDDATVLAQVRRQLA